jgi:DNA-binding MarR family transcriptional regulator
MSRKTKISMPDLAFAYELYREGVRWKDIEKHTGYKKSTIIKSFKRAGA